MKEYNIIGEFDFTMAANDTTQVSNRLKKFLKQAGLQEKNFTYQISRITKRGQDTTDYEDEFRQTQAVNKELAPTPLPKEKPIKHRKKRVTKARKVTRQTKRQVKAKVVKARVK